MAAQAVVVDRHLWLIAGWDPGHKRDGGEILSDIWRLDLSTYQWTLIKPQVTDLRKAQSWHIYNKSEPTVTPAGRL